MNVNDAKQDNDELGCMLVKVFRPGELVQYWTNPDNDPAYGKVTKADITLETDGMPPKPLSYPETHLTVTYDIQCVDDEGDDLPGATVTGLRGDWVNSL
jgi:hypothetical protein